MLSNSQKDSITNPQKFGPVTWYIMHNTALKLNEETFSDWVRLLIDSIPCNNCRSHALEYIEINPPENFLGIENEKGEPIGMFQWTWQFHNNVNIRLNKEILDYDDAYRMYTNDTFRCDKHCGLSTN
jgi:hypothetical protein